MNIKLNLPDSWNDITFNQWKRLVKSVPDNINDLDNVDILKIRIEQAHILNPHIDKEDLMKLSYSQLLEYFQKIDFIDKEPVKADQSKLVIDGNEYEAIDFKYMSLEQFIDAEKYSDILNAHKLIAIFYIEPDKYNDILLDKVAKYIDNSPTPVAFWMVSKFFFIQKALELSINLFSEEMMKEKLKIERIIRIKSWLESKKLPKWFGLKS